MENYRETIEFFDKLSEKWDESQKATEKDLGEFLKFLPIKKGDRVLDVACGTGTISNILFEKSQCDVQAIDISSQMIEIAKNKPHYKEVKFRNINLFDLENEKYDVIVVFNAFPHFVDVNHFENKTKQLLNEKGYLVIAHNLSRKELDTHHAALSKNISRNLDEVKNEFLAFQKDFMDVKLVDNESEFIMVLQKK